MIQLEHSHKLAVHKSKHNQTPFSNEPNPATSVWAQAYLQDQWRGPQKLAMLNLLCSAYWTPTDPDACAAEVNSSRQPDCPRTNTQTCETEHQSTL